MQGTRDGPSRALLQVTLIDQSERFVFKPLLYEVLNETASESEVAPLFDQLLAPYPISFLQVGRCRARPGTHAAACCHAPAAAYCALSCQVMLVLLAVQCRTQTACGAERLSCCCRAVKAK